MKVLVAKDVGIGTMVEVIAGRRKAIHWTDFRTSMKGLTSVQQVKVPVVDLIPMVQATVLIQRSV